MKVWKWVIIDDGVVQKRIIKRNALLKLEEEEFVVVVIVVDFPTGACHKMKKKRFLIFVL
jgi:hypothetical protein